MKITREVVDNAVLQIFADFEIPAGGRLLFSDLRLEWPKTRLRSADMIEGIKRLTFGGLLELDDCSEGPVFILTPEGHMHARALPSGPRGTWNQFVAQTLMAITRRKHSASSPQTGRRMSDLQSVAHQGALTP